MTTKTTARALYLLWFALCLDLHAQTGLLEIQQALIGTRHRFAKNSADVVTTNQLQYREAVRGRLKAGKAGKYAINFGISSGTRFTAGWDNSWLGIGRANRNVDFRALYLSAQPLSGIEAQVGGFYILKGESTEITSYDEDGFIMGERLTLRRPKELFFDEISITNAYLTTDPARIGVNKRFSQMDNPNYQQYLIDKKLGKRAAVSIDLTVLNGTRTWRQGLNIKTKELLLADSVVFESYERTNKDRDYGFALTVTKAVNKRLTLNTGYARIDPKQGGFNSDRFNVGKRPFLQATYILSPAFTASAYVTTGIGNHAALPQRTLTLVAFTCNLMPALKRAKLF